MSLRDRLHRMMSSPEPRREDVGASPLNPVERGTLSPAGGPGTLNPGAGARAVPYERPRPDPAKGAHDYVLVVLDSCRWDSFMAASPTNMSRLGPVERRYSYASWTSPSHYNLLMGLLPHPSPRHVYASDHYREDFLRFRERLGIPDLSFLEMLPRLWLPHFLRNRAGYFVRALTSLPVLNPDTPIASDFDSFELMPRHNDLLGMIERMQFSDERPTFYLLNVGETHYPYALPDEPEGDWPRINGVNGVFKTLDETLRAGLPVCVDGPARIFDQERLDALRARQVETVRYVDRVIEALYERLPPGTTVTITADHGELFGEDGYFGHGPINHEKVLEVPLIEGRLR